MVSNVNDSNGKLPNPGPHNWPVAKKATSLGIMIPVSERATFPGTPHFQDILEMSKASAASGFEGLWFADHFSFPADDGLRGAWDAWTLMAAIAAAVPDVQIGPLVACTAYRNPGVIAKMAEMIDEISGGRFILGLGAGWQKDEYDQFGIQFEPRVSQFEEALEIIHDLLRNGEADVEGKHYQAVNAKNLPRGPRAAGAPILIGSSGDRMLASLAKYADAWNTCWFGSTEGIADKIAKFDAAMNAAGRDPQSVVRTVGISIAQDGYTGSRPNAFAGDNAAKLQFLRDLEQLGFAHIIIGLDPCTPETVKAFAPVIDAFYAGTDIA